MAALAELAADAEKIAGLGHNAPPPESPFDGFATHINDLFEEAKHFLDGEGVNSEGEAEAVSKLLDLIRTASKDADKARAEEKRPHDEAGKAVQAKWKPLLERADLAVDTCKKALSPWLQAQEAAQKAAAALARQEAADKAAAALIALQGAGAADLEARERAEAMVKDAKAAAVVASRAERDRPAAMGGARATTLRTYYRPELVSPKAALIHYAETHPDDLKAFLLSLAETDVREGRRQIPGFVIHSEQRVV